MEKMLKYFRGVFQKYSIKFFWLKPKNRCGIIYPYKKIWLSDLEGRLPKTSSFFLHLLQSTQELFHLEYWKATEYRPSLLYTGVVFLKGIVFFFSMSILLFYFDTTQILFIFFLFFEEKPNYLLCQ